MWQIKLSNLVFLSCCWKSTALTHTLNTLADCSPDLCTPAWQHRSPGQSCSSTHSFPQYPDRSLLYTPPGQTACTHLHLCTGRGVTGLQQQQLSCLFMAACVWQQLTKQCPKIYLNSASAHRAFSAAISDWCYLCSC